jgi:uncharacterized membrane protein
LIESLQLARLEGEVRRVRLIAGIAFIAVSFLIYLAYPVIILLLPSSMRVKFAVIIALWLLSWCAFSAGILLAGLEGYEWLKELWKQKTGGGRAKEKNGNGISR